MRITLFALAALPLYANAQETVDPAVPSGAPVTTTIAEATLSTVIVTSSEAALNLPLSIIDAIVVHTTALEAIAGISDTTPKQPLTHDTTTELPLPPAGETTTDWSNVGYITTERANVQRTTTQLPPVIEDTTIQLPPLAVDLITNLPLDLPTTAVFPHVDTTAEPLEKASTAEPVDQDATAEVPPADTTNLPLQSSFQTTTEAPPIETSNEQPPVQDTATATEQPAHTTQGRNAESTRKDDNEPPLTVAPVFTIPASAATSSLSRVSSQVAALVPFIYQWKDDPEALKDETNNKVKNVHDDIITIIVDMGGKPDVGCVGKKKRGFLGAVINNLVCIAEDLIKVSGGIVDGNVPVAIGAISDFQAKNNELTDEEKEDKEKDEGEKSEGEPSTRQKSTKDSTTVAVTTMEQPTTSDQPTTTTEASTTGTGDSPPCASDTCGDGGSCQAGADPMIEGQMGIMAIGPGDCKTIETTTTDGGLPTTPGNLGVFSVTEPTSHPKSGSKERLGLSARVFTDNTTPNPFYVMVLRPTWVSQQGRTSGKFYPFPKAGHAAAGVKGLFGCTAVVIVSDKGVYLSHIFENPVFVADADYTPTSENDFRRMAFEALRDGTTDADSLTYLIGTEASPGPLHPIYSPKVFIITPLTLPNDPNGVTTRLRYQDRAQTLASSLSSVFSGSEGRGNAYVLSYTRTNPYHSTVEPGYLGRAILEVDMLQSVLVSTHDPHGDAIAVARWRLWVEDQLIAFNDFWSPDVFDSPTGAQKRDDPNNECLFGGDSTGTTLSAPSSTHVNVETAETGATDGVTTTGGSQESTSTKDSDTAAIEIATSAYTSTPKITTEAADETETFGPATVPLSTLLTTTRPVSDADSITSGSTDLATTSAPTRTYYPCIIYGGPRVASAYCQCVTTVSGKRYVATTSMVDHKCVAYTEFPSKIGSDPEPLQSTKIHINNPLTQTSDGTVLAWSSYQLNYDQVYNHVTVTYSEGLGPARTLQTPVPIQTAVDNDGSGQCSTSDSLSKTGLGDACDRAISVFDDDTIYTDYTTRYSRSTKGLLMVASLGQAACIAKFSCDDYGIGMSGKLIKEAREHAKSNDNIWLCGHIELSNSCRVVMDYCTNCKNEG